MKVLLIACLLFASALAQTVHCRSNDDCKKLGQAFCNFDYEISGFCEFCSDIDDCATESFITKEGNKACAEVCDAGPSGCKQYDNVYGDCLDFTSHDEGEGSYELCSLSCLNSETCAGIQTDSEWQLNCEHLKSLEGVEGCRKGKFTIISRECFETTPEPEQTGCFLDPSTPIDDCECDPSCASCGYYDSPTEPADCITCADGSNVIPFYDDGTGFCSGRAPEDDDGCYRQPGVPIARRDCKCDPSCKSCGYNAKPTLPSDCIICADGSEVKPAYSDGTGYCGPTPDPMSDAGCFLNDLVMIPNCKCHPSCKSCGYTSDPTSAADCITCIDGSEVNPVYGDGTGTCGPTPNPLTDSGCFEDPGTWLADCKCDPSCKSCGYYEQPSQPDDCITCADGSEVTPVYGDGTGTCQ